MGISFFRPKIGEIYYMNFSGQDSEQKGWRPGLVFQNNVGNAYSPNIIALPITSSVKKTDLPTHVFIPSDNSGLKTDSMILCENPERMSKSKVGGYITKASDHVMRQVAEASLLASSVISYLEPADLLSVWQKSVSINSSSK